MDRIDIYRTARLLIERHGSKATIEAAMRSDEMMDLGDLHGVAVWNRVMRAIDELRAADGGTVN